MSILLYGCTTWTLTKRMEKRLGDNYTRMLRTVLNKSWKQHPTKQMLYGHLSPISKTIQIKRTRYAWHCWRSDVLRWTPSLGLTKVGRPARTDLQSLCTDTGCCLEDLPGVMDDRNVVRESQGNPCLRHDMMMMMKGSLYYFVVLRGVGPSTTHLESHPN